ncbi:MAG TPA: hypothetical protein VN803_15450 [Gemmatimonadales bacterium]|nr:hypothetical protein [Gemmatimonadales bacterium]
MALQVDEKTGEVIESTIPKPFSQFLVEQRSGGMHGELSDKLQELVAAVAQHDKAGTLTLTVSVKPIDGRPGQYIVVDDVKVKAPEAPRGSSLFFADDHGNLSRSDPRQPELPLREVPATPNTIREVPGA